MASSLNVLLTINAAGMPIPFAQPFTVPILELEQEPAVYQVTIDVDSSGTVWDGAPLGATADFIALVTDRQALFEIVNGEGSFFIEADTPGIPTLISGGQINVGGGLSPITQINATNLDTENSMIVSAIIGQAAS